MGLKPIKLKCVTQEHLLTYLCWYASVNVSQSEKLNCANNCIDDASSLVWIFDLRFAAIFIQTFAGAIRCPIERFLVMYRGSSVAASASNLVLQMLATSLISKNATIVLILQ